MHVLIVEDDTRMADALTQMLDMLGHTADIASSSRQAMSMAQYSIPELILLDLNLPDVDGLEVCGYFKRDPELEHTPIIVVSADGDPQSIKEARQAGAVDYLVKPISLTELEAAILRAV